MNNDKGKLCYALGLDNEQLKADALASRNIIKGIGDTASSEGARIDDTFRNIARGAAAAVFTLRQAIDFAKQIATVRGEFQQLEVAFTTMLGSKAKADALMARTVDFAAKTPFDLQGVAQGTKQLLAYGSKAENVTDELRMLGNIAAGLSIPLGDIVYLYGTTRTQGRVFTHDMRQFMGRDIPIAEELAKQLGVTKDKISALVTEGKIGFPEVQKALQAMTSEGGKFYNLMEEQSKTIGGKISNLGDSIQQAMNNIGQSSEGAINTAIDGTSYLVENYEKIGKSIAELVVAYGVYKATIITLSALEKARYTATLAIGAAEKSITTWQALRFAWTNKLEAAQEALNDTMLKNPYVRVAALVAGLAYGIYKLATYQTDAEKAQKRLNDAVSASVNSAAKEISELDRLKGKLKECKDGTEEYKKTKEEIVKKFGQYDSTLKAETLTIDNLAKKYKHLKTAIIDSINARGYDKYIKEAESKFDEKFNESGENLYNRLAESDLGAERAAEVYQKMVASIYNNESMMAGNMDKDVERILKKSTQLRRNFYAMKEAYDTYNQSNTLARKRFGVKDESEDKVKDLKAAEESLSILTGKDKSSDKKSETEAARIKRETAERAKRIKEYEEAAKLQDEQAELNIRQTNLDCADDSYKKEQEQNDLLYDRLILANKHREAEMVKELRDARELQWENKNPKAKAKGETFDRSTVTAADLSSKQKAELAAYEKFAAKEKEKANQALLEKLIADFGTYEQKRAAIAEKWEKKIASLPEEYRKEARRQMIEEIAALDEESKKKTAILTKLFGNMSKKAVKDIRAIADEAQRMIDYISEGEFKTDNEGKGLFGLTKEQFDILSKSPEKLQAIKDEIANVNKEADAMGSAFDKVGDGITKMFNAKGDSAEFKDGLASLAEGLGEIKQALDFISDSFSKLGEAFDNEVLKKISEGINIATDAMSSAMEGAFAGLLIGGPIGAGIGAALGLFSSLAAAIAKIKDAKNEEQIQQMQNQIDTLEKSYELLDKTINKAYSKDASKLIEQQNTLLEQQKVLIQNQIAEEEAKKNSDEERINKWRGQIDDINRTITDNKEKAIDAIFGEDLKTAIDNFAAAYANAWTSNEDRVKSARDTIRDMMRQMVTTSIQAAIQSSNKMEEIRSKLKEFYEDGVLSDWEQKYVYKMGEELQSELDNKFGWADSLMKDEKEDTREASAKGIAAASQDSVNELNGRMTAVQGHTFLLSENSKILVANSNRVLDHLAGIEDNTRNLSRLEAIETGVRELKRSIDDISLKGIKIK